MAFARGCSLFFFKGVGKGEKIVLRYVVCRENVSNLRLTVCDGSGFVKGYDLNLSGFLKGDGCFEKDTCFGTHSVSNHNATGVARPRAHGQLMTRKVSARMIQSSQLPSNSGGTTASTSAPMQTAGV